MASKAIRYIAVRDCFHKGRYFSKGTIFEVGDGGETPASEAFEVYDEKDNPAPKIFDPTADVVKQMKVGKATAGLMQP